MKEWHKTVFTTPIGGNPNMFFTTCCGIQIDHSQDNCPRCNEEINPKGKAARIDAVKFIDPRYVR